MSQGTWSQIELGGHSGLVYDPPRPHPQNYLVLYLHDLSQEPLRNHPAFTEPLDRHGLRLLAPLTGPSWWTERIFPPLHPQISAVQFVRETVVPAAAERWGTRPPGIALLGTEMGGQGALRLAFLYPDTFPVAAAIAPAIDYYLMWGQDETLTQMYGDPETARQDSVILHIHPLYWPRHIWFGCDITDIWYTGADRLRMKLSALGIPYQCQLELQTRKRGFASYDPLAAEAIDFLADRLERERLRVC